MRSGIAGGRAEAAAIERRPAVLPLRARLIQGCITEEAVARLVGQTPRLTYDSTDVGRVRIVRAWVEDGWVVVEMEPVDG